MMQTFGALLETATTVVPQVFAATPDHPVAQRTPESDFQQRAKRATHGHDLSAYLATQAKLTEAVADRAQAQALAAPDSEVLAARWAQAAAQAGRIVDAQDAAVCVLALIERKAEAGEATVTAAAHVAVAILRSHESSDTLNMLDRLPQTDRVRFLRAEVAADLADPALGLAALVDAETREACSLRGYFLLLQEKYAEALHELRLARGYDPSDVNVLANMSLAYRGLGAHNKSLRMLEAAIALAPGRKDISLRLISQLTGANLLERATREVRRVKEMDVVEPAYFLALQAQIFLKLGQRRQASDLLRAAASRAESEGEDQLAVELDANRVLTDYALDRVPLKAAMERVREGIRRAPTSTALVWMLSDMSTRTTMVSELRTSFDRVVESGAKAQELLPIAARLSFLECRFEEAAIEAQQWSIQNPWDDAAQATALMLHAQVTEDWRGSARRAKEVLRQLPSSVLLANNAAYVLALGGDARYAATVIEPFVEESFVAQATLGLARIATGNMASGTALYRLAADRADKEDSSGVSRALMTLHQSMALKQLDIAAGFPGAHVRSLLLPEVSLPANWQHVPWIQLLKWRAAKNNWPWPTMVA